MPPTQPTALTPPAPAGPRNLPPPTEPGGARPLSGTAPKANRVIKPLSEAPPPPQPDKQHYAQNALVQPTAPATTPAQPVQPAVGQPEESQPPPPTAVPSFPEELQGQPEPASQQQGTDAEKARDQLDQAIDQSKEILITAQTAVPIFPDVVTVDRAKVTVAKRTFFRTAEVMSIRVEDLLNVTANIGIVFGIVYISNRVNGGDEPTTVGPFWRKDAITLKRITQGYVIALQRSIDVSELSCNELRAKLEKLGEDDHPNAQTGEPSA